MIGTAGASLGKWARFIDANDATPALTINQRGLGDILSMESGGVEVAKFDNSGNLVFTGSITVDFGDDAGLAMGASDDADLRYSTQDGNAMMMQWGLPHVDEEANNVAVLALMDRDLVGTDLSGVVDLSGTTEPTLAIINEAGNAGIIIGAATVKSNTGTLTIDGDDGLILQTTGSGLVQVKETLVLGVGEAATGSKTGDVLRGPDHPGGTDSNLAGADITISPGLGTGTGDVGTIIFQLPEVVTAGSVVQTRATVLTMDMVASTTLMSFTFGVNTAIDSSGTLQIRPTTGVLFMGDSNITVDAVTGMTTGIQIDQGAADDAILLFKSSDVAHAITGTAMVDADTWGLIKKAEAAAGGISIEGFKDGDGVAGHAIHIIGTLDETNADTTKSTSGIGVITIDAALEATNVRGVLGADGNILAVRNLTTTVMIVDEDGDLWLNGGITAGGVTPLGSRHYLFGGVFASDGSSSVVIGQNFRGALTAEDGDTSHHAGTWFANTITTQNNSETIPVIAQVFIDEPVIAKGTDTVTIATTLYIAAAPTEGVTNAAIYVASGTIEGVDFVSGAGEGAITARTGGTIRAASAAAGGTGNIPGADLTVTPGAGTGTGDVGQLIFKTYQVATAGDNLQTTLETILTLDEDAAVFAKNIFVTEVSAAVTDVAGLGQIWVKDDTPNTPYFTDDTGVDRQIVTADYAGITIDGNAGATPQDVQHGFELIAIFDTDLPEAISNGANGTNSITIGATGVYTVQFCMSAVAGGANKTYEFFAFELASSGSSITSSTAADPVVVTATGHGFSTGNKVKITGVTTADELNERIFTITVLTGDTFSLQEDNGGDIDGTGFGVGSGGTATLATQIAAVHSHRKFTAADVGSISGGGLVSLTKDNTLELYVKNIGDTTTITVEHCSFMLQRIS